MKGDIKASEYRKTDTIQMSGMLLYRKALYKLSIHLYIKYIEQFSDINKISSIPCE